MKRRNIRWFPPVMDMVSYWLKHKLLVDSAVSILLLSLGYKWLLSWLLSWFFILPHRLWCFPFCWPCSVVSRNLWILLFRYNLCGGICTHWKACMHHGVGKSRNRRQRSTFVAEPHINASCYFSERRRRKLCPTWCYETCEAANKRHPWKPGTVRGWWCRVDRWLCPSWFTFPEDLNAFQCLELRGGTNKLSRRSLSKQSSPSE